MHTACRDQIPKKCPLSQCRVSILPPTAINSMDSDGYWEAMRPPGTSPLLVFVNTKSGDNQVSAAVITLIIQSILVISKSKGPSETLQDISTSTYQICKIEGNTK